MPSARVVPTLYPSKDNQPCFGLGLPAASSYQLTLQAGKEALGHSVVIRVAHGSHGWAYAHFLAAVAKGNAGAQYTSEHFQELLKEQGITCSMSRAGEVWDNSAMESFFSSLKTERTARKVYRSREQARADVFDYIERFYNPTRRHSTLGYVSPINFEKAQKA